MSIQPFIKCSQIKESLAFYTEILDFKVRQAPDPDPDGNHIRFGQRSA